MSGVLIHVCEDCGFPHGQGHEDNCVSRALPFRGVPALCVPVPHLYAAAPELLAALSKIILVGESDCVGAYTDGWNDLLASIHAIARPAIAKAEGK